MDRKKIEQGLGSGGALKGKLQGWWGASLYNSLNYFRVRAPEIFSNKFREKT